MRRIALLIFLPLLLALLTVAVGPTLTAQDPSGPQPQPAADGPEPVFPDFINSLRDATKTVESVQLLAPTSRRILVVISVASLGNPQLSGGLNEVLKKHSATALTNTTATLPGITVALQKWDASYPGIKDEAALLVDLLRYAMINRVQIMPPPPATVTFGARVVERRGEFGWVLYDQMVNGRAQGQVPTIMRLVDGKWRLLAFNNAFQMIAGGVLGHKVESWAHYDVAAMKVTRERLLALEQATVKLAAPPAAAADQSTAPLLAALKAAGALDALPEGTVDGDTLRDGWNNPLRYAGKTGDSPFVISSGGADGTSGNEDDERTRKTPVADKPARPRVEFTFVSPDIATADHKGKVVIELYEDEAPNSVSNFVKLVESGFYNTSKFHRIIDGFMIQGGDPNTKTGVQPKGPPGTGDAGYNLPDEITPDFSFDGEGILAYANSGLNTSSCQFFITLAPSPSLNDGMGPRGPTHYTILGKVVEGMEHVRAVGKTKVSRNPQSGEPSVPMAEQVLESAKVLNKREHGYGIFTLPR